MIALLALAGFLPAASAHGAGGPTTKSGTFVLGKAGSATALADQFLSGFGLAVSSGDVFQFTWESDAGAGPPIYFEIHRHVPTYVVYYNSTTSRDNGTWTVPGSDPYMVFWQNPNNQSKLVAYSFVVNHGFDVVLYGGIIGVVVAISVAVVVLRSRIRARRGASHSRDESNARDALPPPK